MVWLASSHEPLASHREYTNWALKLTCMWLCASHIDIVRRYYLCSSTLNYWCPWPMANSIPEFVIPLEVILTIDDRTMSRLCIPACKWDHHLGNVPNWGLNERHPASSCASSCRVARTCALLLNCNFSWSFTWSCIQKGLMTVSMNNNQQQGFKPISRSIS